MAKMSRRTFLSRVTTTVVGGIGALMGIPTVAYLVSPAKARGGLGVDAIPLGPASKVPIGEPTLFKTAIERKTGWVTQTEELAFYLLTEDGRNFTAMSNVCTHLGCRVRWLDSEEQFFCPCHSAAFNKNGTVASGPPPRALDQYEISVEDDQLFIVGKVEA
ncbi:MAG TPA: ubiquinol-cytochrome c reductase iron-sulfur subunit [Acidimicrobiia bacterium]|nr:ubiquinol-cytochrome c reductase iron-sulfur subunit [Acidimicrobiia bacterium]